MATNKKNILPELTDTVLNSNIKFYESSSQLLNIFQDTSTEDRLVYIARVDVPGNLFTDSTTLSSKYKSGISKLRKLEVEEYKAIINGGVSPTAFQRLKIPSLDVVNFFIELEDTKTSDNVHKNLTNKYITLNNNLLKINNSELPNNFKLYLNEKFQNLLYIFKAAITKNLDDKEKSIFSNYSDDIGMTLEINHNLGVSNTPIFDTYYNLQKNGPPITIPPIMMNKVSNNVLKNFKKMSLKNDALLKRNLRNIAGYGVENLCSTSHGLNLVYDNFTAVTQEELTNIKTTQIFNEFGEQLGDLITFYKNLNIRQQPDNKAFLVKYANKIEGVENVLDVFNNNIYSTTPVNIPFLGN
jgi:hypothetical protein